jgi:hypothetical protein
MAETGFLAAAPDGAVHSADGRGAIVTSRVVDGELRRERTDTDGTAGITELRRPYGLALAPDGSSLYAVSYVDWLTSAIVMFRRDTSGALTFAGSFRPTPRGFENDRGLPKEERLVVAGGARYVNERTVDVHTQPPAQLLKGLSTVSSLRISVDGAPGPFRRLAPDSRYAVELAGGGEHRIGVEYTHPPWDFGLPLTWEGSVVLDQRRPVVRGARLARTGRRYALRVRARDDRSGVASVQVAGRRSAPRRAVRFRKSLRVARPRSVRWLRVRDAAGNASRWRRVARAR